MNIIRSVIYCQTHILFCLQPFTISNHHYSTRLLYIHPLLLTSSPLHPSLPHPLLPHCLTPHSLTPSPLTSSPLTPHSPTPYSLTPSPLTSSLPHLLTPSLTHSLTSSLPCPSLPHSLTPSLPHSLTPSPLPLLPPPPPPLTRIRRLRPKSRCWQLAQFSLIQSGRSCTRGQWGHQSFDPSPTAVGKSWNHNLGNSCTSLRETGMYYEHHTKTGEASLSSGPIGQSVLCNKCFHCFIDW